MEGELELEDTLQEEDRDWFTKLLLHFVFKQKDFIIQEEWVSYNARSSQDHLFY